MMKFLIVFCACFALALALNVPKKSSESSSGSSEESSSSSSSGEDVGVQIIKGDDDDHHHHHHHHHHDDDDHHHHHHHFSHVCHEAFCCFRNAHEEYIPCLRELTHQRNFSRCQHDSDVRQAECKLYEVSKQFHQNFSCCLHHHNESEPQEDQFVAGESIFDDTNLPLSTIMRIGHHHGCGGVDKPCFDHADAAVKICHIFADHCGNFKECRERPDLVELLKEVEQAEKDFEDVMDKCLRGEFSTPTTMGDYFLGRN